MTFENQQFALIFKTLWETNLHEFETGLVTLKKDSQHTHALHQDVIEFLTSVGLPEDAAPYLNFRNIGEYGLAKVYDIWATPEDYKSEEKQRLDHFLVIGSDGCGSPITIDIRNGSIVLLDHDDWFHTVEFMNSSIFQLAAFLLAVRDMIKQGNASEEPRDENGKRSQKLKRPLVEKLKLIDEEAAQPKGYWLKEIAML